MAKNENFYEVINDAKCYNDVITTYPTIFCFNQQA